MRGGQAAFGSLGGGIGWPGTVGIRYSSYSFDLPLQRLDLLLECNDPLEVGDRKIRKRFHVGKDAYGLAGAKPWLCAWRDYLTAELAGWPGIGSRFFRDERLCTATGKAAAA